MIKVAILFFLKTFNAFYNRAIFYFNGVNIGVNVVVNGRIYIKNSGYIYLGDNVVINSGHSYNPIGGQAFTRLIVGPGGVLRIKDGVGISNSTIVVQTQVTIGRNAMIGGSCNIWDTDFHSLDADIRGKSNDLGKSIPISIGEMSFIGAHCILLKGTCLGSRVIVGAGSIGSLRVGDNEVFVRR